MQHAACEKIINLLPANLKKMIVDSNFNGLVDFGLETKVDYKKVENIFTYVHKAQLEKKSIYINYI